jgi:hypothetical protein
MTATSTSRAELVGRSFDCDLGAFIPRLTFMPGHELRVQAKLGDTDIDQVVKAEVIGVRPDLFIVSWTEDNGNFIVQLQDHAKASFTITHGWPMDRCSAPKANWIA